MGKTYEALKKLEKMEKKSGQVKTIEKEDKILLQKNERENRHLLKLDQESTEKTEKEIPYFKSDRKYKNIGKFKHGQAKLEIRDDERHSASKGDNILDSNTHGNEVVTYDYNKIDKNLISVFSPNSFEAEQFKILRTNLLYPRVGEAPRSILITSVAPGEGKSFIAANLATNVALNINRHVLLIDCDFRRPKIHSFFGFDKVSGLSDYLNNKKILPDLLLRTNFDRLVILPAGPIPSNPSELLSSERMSDLLREVVLRYNDRLIIIDSPPHFLTSDTAVLAHQVDGILLVAKYGKTQRANLKDLTEKLGRNKIIGSIINEFDMRSLGFQMLKQYRKYERYSRKKKNLFFR